MSSGEINRIPQFSGLEPEYETRRPPHRQKMDGSACQTLLRALVDHTGPSRPCFIQPIRRTRSPGALGPPPGPGLSRPGVYTTAYCMVRPTTCFKVRVLPTIYGYYVLHTSSTGTSTWSGLRGSTRPDSPQSPDRGCPQGRPQSPLWRCTHAVSLVRLLQGTVVACVAMAEPIRTDHTTGRPIVRKYFGFFPMKMTPTAYTRSSLAVGNVLQYQKFLPSIKAGWRQPAWQRVLQR